MRIVERRNQSVGQVAFDLGIDSWTLRGGYTRDGMKFAAGGYSSNVARVVTLRER